jgi:ClpP class serine protease
LPIFGVISQKSNWLTRALGWTSAETLQRDFREAIANNQVKAIVLYVDSPGGTTLGCKRHRKPSSTPAPQSPSMRFPRPGASAAYWIGSSRQRNVRVPLVDQRLDRRCLDAHRIRQGAGRNGVGVTVVRSAPNKQLWNPYEKLDGEAKASLQKFVSDVGNQFELDVARNRGVSQATVKAKFGQGNIYTAAEATQRGLVDGVLTWEQMLAKANESTPASGVSAAASAAISIPTAEVLQGRGVPASPVPAAVATPPEKPIVKISARVRAALFARGLITAQEADESICIAALGAYFAARGEACPQNSEKTGLDDDKVVAALFAITPGAAASAASATAIVPATAAAATGAAANVQQAHEREMLEARQQSAVGERERQKAIRASAKLLSMPEAAITAAIDGGKSHAEVVAAWHVELASRDKPVTAPATAAGGTSEGADRFVADAVLALQHRMGRLPQAQVNDDVRRLSRAPLAHYAQQCLALSNIRVPEFLTAEELFEAAFAMDGAGHFGVGATYSPYNRPGSFPNLLSNLANKILDAALELAEPTYEEWTGVWPGDLPDFKPAPVVNKGQHDELDEILDAEASKSFGLDEEILGAMLLRRYSNKFELTPVMAANDDLSAFDEGLLGLEMAWQNTVNRGCVRVLTSNVALLDGNALYDNTTHGNDIAGGGGGGPPSDAQWDAMQLKVAAQQGIGSKGYIRTPLKIALVAPKIWRQATQAFAMFRFIGESKLASTDTNVNIYRGDVTVVREPELQAFSGDVWYGFARPSGMLNATVVRAYFRGWGKNGRRQRWYDPETKCWNFELEGRVGIAPKQYRLTVRNNGVN